MKRLSVAYAADDTEVIFCENDEDVLRYISSANILVTFTNGISAEWLAKAKECVLIQKLGIGVNNIDIDGANRRKIPVANTPGLNATAVAEHTVALMTSTLKHIVNAYNKMVYEGKWLKTGLRDFSYQLSHKKVGLIGFGNIGREVRRILRGYDCEVFYYDLYRLSPEEEKELDIKYVEFNQLIQESDVVSLHVPLNKHTYHLMGKNNLEKMKKTAILINACRGGVIDEKALYEVLKSGHLTGVGLDVFETEPITKNNMLTTLPNAVLTPHIAGGTNEAMEAVAAFAFENINSMLKTGKVINTDAIVNLNALDVI